MAQTTRIIDRIHTGKVAAPCPRMICTRASKPSVRASAGKNDVNSMFTRYAAGSQDNNSQSEAPVPTWRFRDSQIAPPSRPPPPKPSSAANVLRCGPGLATLLAVNAGVYAAAVWGGRATTVATMVLPAVNAKWWQWVSSAFVHASSEHLTRNLSVVWLAGSMVAPEVGGAGVWFAYLLAAAGANLSAMMFMPAKIKAAGGLLGLAATGGAAGLSACALIMGVRPTPGFVLSAVAFISLALAPLLRTPVPGGPAAALPLPYGLWGAWVGSGVGGVRDVVRSAVADPGLSWLWGALAAAVVVVAMARFPDGPP